MWNKFKKGVSLIEALVAMFVLSLITLAYMNSSNTFIRNQQNLIDLDKRDQIAELILQGIMEYRKNKVDHYGTATVNTDQTMSGETNTIQIILTQCNDPEAEDCVILTGDDVIPPKLGDVFLIDGIKGKHVIDGIEPTDGARIYTLTTDKLISESSLSNGDGITFIAFQKDEMICFANEFVIMDLTEDTPTSRNAEECPSVPQGVQDLHTYWQNMIATELPDVTIAKVEIEEDSIDKDKIIKVTIGDADHTTVQASKINTCIFSFMPSTVKFTFPGLDPIETAIMEGTESPVLHYLANGVAATYNNGNSGATTNRAGDASCDKVQASTCRQNYADKNTFTVFMYKYNGEDTQTWKPSGCNAAAVGNWQCPGVEVREGDLSIWFIFDHYNNNTNADRRYIDRDYPGDNGSGQLTFRTNNLPDDAKILVFDDASESCLSPITGGSCTGLYWWRGAHDGLVIHLDTDDVNNLSDIQLEILKVPYDVNQWRVLKANAGNCSVASRDNGSLHGDQHFREELEDPPSSCWTYIGKDSADDLLPKLMSPLANAIDDNILTLTVDDATIFPTSGIVQVGNEEISYTGKSGNTLTGLVRGFQRYPITLGADIAQGDANNSTVQLNSVGNDSGLAYGGGYVKINDEIIKVKYLNTPNIQNNIITLWQRAQFGTNKVDHNTGDVVLNYDVRATDHSIDAPVWDISNSIATTMNETYDGTYVRESMKKSVSLNLSSANVCQ